jgi:hypothetical protein
MPDGKRILGVVGAARNAVVPGTPEIEVVENWVEELKQRIPTKQ